MVLATRPLYRLTGADPAELRVLLFSGPQTLLGERPNPWIWLTLQGVIEGAAPGSGGLVEGHRRAVDDDV